MDMRARVAADRWCLAAVIGGMTLRLRHYCFNRNLWLDESYLTYNLAHRDFRGLLKPLHYDQGAPLGFLFAEKAIVAVLGMGERALRLLPLLAGCLTLVFTWRFCRRIAGPRASVMAVAYVALCPALIYYASEVKQYSSDAMLAVLLLWLWARTRAGDGSRLGWLAVVGCLAPWFSHPAVFVLAGLGLVSLVRAIREKRPRELAALVLMGMAWLASFAVSYVGFVRPLGKNAYLVNFWSKGFLPRPTLSIDAFNWIYWSPFQALEYPASFDFEGLAFWLIVLAMLRAPARERPGVLAAIAVIGVTWCAALTRIYPFTGRLILFLVPLQTVLIASGLAALDRLTVRRRRPAGPGRHAAALLCVAILIFNPAFSSLKTFARPEGVEEICEMLRIVADRSQEGDTLVVSSYSTPAFQYYADRFAIRAQPVLMRFRDGNDLPPLASNDVWVLFSQNRLRSGVSMEEEPLLGLIGKNGFVLAKRYEGNGCWLYHGSRPATAGVSVPLRDHQTLTAQ